MKIKQVVIVGQHQVELQTAALDEKQLGPSDVLIETEYTYISTGTELANYSGSEPKVSVSYTHLTLPTTPYV